MRFLERSTLKSLYWIGQRRRGRSPPNRLTSLDFKEGLTDREYYALSSSISQIETVDPSQCFDERRYFYIRKNKGECVQLAYKLLGTYDNKNIINYIRELVNINNTTDKNLMRCRLRPEGRRGVFKL
jgi:hypothetical protein